MGDLIDRKALLAECAEAQKSDPYFKDRGWANHFINEAGKPSTEWYAVEAMIEDAPAVDAAPVVRCGDCKFCSRFRNSLICDKHTDLDTFYVAPDFYCADGKRRDGGEQQCD